MPQLKSMKRSPEELAERRDDMTGPPDPEEYPWGLRLHLDADTIEKLGIGMPGVDDRFELSAVATVKSVRKSDDVEFGEEKSVELQIEDLGMSEAAVDPGERLYPSSGAGGGA